jgi:uncharacterized Zn-binding protein involved in type VI secretion
VVQGPGVPTVLVEGLPVAVVLDIHACGLAPPAGPHPPSPFPVGSATVYAGGRPVLRMGDASACGATILLGAVTVEAG